MKYYRFSLDDNIWVFRDLAYGRYHSIFDHPYKDNSHPAFFFPCNKIGSYVYDKRNVFLHKRQNYNPQGRI